MCHRSSASMSLVQLIALALATLALVSNNLVMFSLGRTHEIHLFGKTLTASEPEAQNSSDWPRAVNNLAEYDRLNEEHKKLYLDSKCFVDLVNTAGGEYLYLEPTSEVVKYLLKLKCDLKPLLRMFVALLMNLDQTLPTESVISDGSDKVDFHFVSANAIGMDRGEESANIWRQYSTFYQAVDEYVQEAIQLLSQRAFCTYTTIAKFSKLISLTRGSQLLNLANDLVIMDYHSSCLLSTIEKLPEVPYVVKDVVKMYIDGVEDTRTPDLNDPAQLELEATGFDIDEAVRREGTIDQVASLMLTIPSGARGGSLKDLFRSECQSLLMNLEQQWQPMEMMNQMLATESNSIHRLNNLIMQSIIPQKYAQICSQLVVKA